LAERGATGSPVEYCVNINGVRFCVCRNVYEPAEDTWLALSLIDELAEEGLEFPVIVDVGSGTGVLGVYALERLAASLLVLVDVNPYACKCSMASARESRAGHAADVVCCDNITCLGCGRLSGSLIIYNTPYLPVEDSGELGLAWSGGIREAVRTVYAALACRPRCLVLVYSSLSGDDEPLLSYIRMRGYSIRRRVAHYFFEDIIGVKACRRG
jgi:release factor glutamine methyltransferase